MKVPWLVAGAIAMSCSTSVTPPREDLYKMPLRALILFGLLAASCAAPAVTTVPPAASPTVAAATSTPAAAPTVSPMPIALPTIVQLSVPNATVAWALVGGTRLFRSVDRGDTWQERTVPQPLLIGDITFVNEREGWISAPGSPTTQCQTQSVAIWHSVDGAATWERVYQSDFVNDGMCKNDLSFADAQHGFLTLSSPSSSAVIARTADSGRTWTRSQALPDPPGFTTQGAGYTLRASRVRAFGSTLLVSVIGQGFGNGKRYAFRSTDGGATWTYAGMAPQDEIEVSFVTATRWLQIVLPDQSKETTDAGASWHPFTTDYRQAAPIAPQIVFGDANVGYATVRGGLQRTVDGGAHWTYIFTPGTR